MRDLFKVQVFLTLTMPILLLCIVESVEENRILELNPRLLYYLGLCCFGKYWSFPYTRTFVELASASSRNLNVRVTITIQTLSKLYFHFLVVHCFSLRCHYNIFKVHISHIIPAPHLRTHPWPPTRQQQPNCLPQSLQPYSLCSVYRMCVQCVPFYPHRL